jgi:tetratricopeptide (TPR) repeat protein
MVLTRLWNRLTGSKPSPLAVRIFQRARRCRDEGRFEEAAALVAEGLRLDPDSLVGHLLAGSLHAVFRETRQARAAFERVLALDPMHPRALLGLARMALEEGEAGTCTLLLTRALARYPDFPEAQALLDVVLNPPARATAARPAPQGGAIRADRLRVPADSRETLLARADGTPIFAQPRGLRTEELAARIAQLCKVASATLARSGLGALHHAVVDGAAERTFLRADGDMVLSLAFSREVRTDTALAHLERVWANCRAELAGRSA